MSDTTCRAKIYFALYFDPFKQFVPVQYVKAVVRKFCFFVGVSVWKPGIAVLCGIIFLAWVVLRHGLYFINKVITIIFFK